MNENPKSTLRTVTRRGFLRLGLALGGMAALAGCSAPGSSGPAAANSGGSVAVPTANPAGAPAAAKKAVITYWTPLDHKDTTNARSKAEVAMVDLFRKKYPNVEVNAVTVPWQKMDDQIIQAAAAGKGPDVAQLSTFGLPLQVPAHTLLPLDDYVGKSWTKEEKEDFLMPRENTVYGGANYGFYWNSILYDLLFYRKDMLEEKKLTLPKSWSELAQTGKALSEGRVSGYLLGLSKDGNAVQLTGWLIPALWSVGADLLDDKGQVAFNNDAGIKAFQWIFDMVHTYKAMPEGVLSITRDNMLDAFKAGTAAMTTLGSNVVSNARASAAGKNMALAPNPGIEAGKPMPAFTAGKFMAMSKDCKEREAAGLFIESQLSPEAQTINAKIAGELPSRASVLKDPWFNTPEGADMKLQLEYMRQYPRKFQYHPKNNILADLLAGACQAIVAKQTPIKAALDDLSSKWAAELKG